MADDTARYSTRSTAARSPLFNQTTVRDDATHDGATHPVSASIEIANSLVSDMMPAQSKRAATQADVSRLGHDFEPLNLDSGASTMEMGSTAAEEVLGRDVKDAIATMGRLEALGLQKLDIPIPRCIVLGQQSTGKSSVIEAISGIKTPRDTGTCTCCPLYITMQPSDDPSAGWAASVSLQQDYDLDIQVRSRGRSKAFLGWTEASESRTTAFATTRSPEELENIIRCAQAANLCPLEQPKSFLAGPEPRPGAHRCKFSPNPVRIDITEPGLPTLSFFDLPGIISQAETDEEAYAVPLVHNLVTEYVKRPNALILVTADLGQDLANSTAASLAKKLKAANRCVGVLTKPDLLPPGTPDSTLISVLQGSKYTLGHGYFVIKNLNKEQILQGLSNDDARNHEQAFFANGRWSSGLRQFQSRFGTRNLKLYVSKQLASQTVQNLPAIYEQIFSRLRGVEEELAGMPQTPLHGAVRIVSDLVHSFSSDVYDEISEDFGHLQWSSIWNKLRTTFKEQLQFLQPTMSTIGIRDKGLYLDALLGKSMEDSIMLSENDDDRDGSGIESDLPETPSKKRKIAEATPASSPFKTPTKPQNKTFNMTPALRSAETKLDGLVPQKKRFTLDEVAAHINRSSKTNVPEDVHQKAKDQIMVSQLQHWEMLVDMFFESFKRALTEHIKFLFCKHFDIRAGSELYQKAWLIVNELLANNFTQQKNTMVKEVLEHQTEKPYIFDQAQYAEENSKVGQHFLKARQQSRFRMYVSEMEQHRDKVLTQVEREKISRDEHKMAIIKAEPYATELGVLVDARAYYNIASRRLHDSICMRIEFKFFRQLRFQLRNELEAGLGIYDGQEGPQNAQRLLEESNDQRRRRKELLAHKMALLQGLECLESLRDKYKGEPEAHADAPIESDSHVRPFVISAADMEI